MKNQLDDETYVPLKDKKKHDRNRVSSLIFVLILLGTGLFFSLVMILRTGGMPRLLFVILSLCLGYLIIGAVKKVKSIKNQTHE